MCQARDLSADPHTRYEFYINVLPVLGSRIDRNSRQYGNRNVAKTCPFGGY